MKNALLKKIGDRTCKIGIIGLGYVGLPLGMAFAKKGFTVTGVDVAPGKVDLLMSGRSYIEDVSSDEIKKQVASGKFSATTDFSALKTQDAIIICVPTPLRKTREPDISYIVAATNETARHFGTGKLVVLESTTYPGTTSEVVQPALEANGLKVGEDFFLAFSPERVDPGNSKYGIENTPKVVGGSTPACTELAAALYASAIEKVVPVQNTASAEMVKLLENTFRAVNIGLVNEIALICDKLGLDVWEIIDAASTKPFGFMKFVPGPGLGGHCIPVDPHYLSWKMRLLNYNARFIELAAEINSAMPEHVVSKVIDALNGFSRSLRGSKVLVLGLAYKKNTSDMRESPALDICKHLSAKGAKVHYFDPHVATLDGHGHEVELGADWSRADTLTPELLSSMDCTVIATDHDGVDYPAVAANSKLVVDARNALRGIPHGNCTVISI